MIGVSMAHGIEVLPLGPVGPTDTAAAAAAFERAVAALKHKRFAETDLAARAAYSAGYGADAVELVAVAALQTTHVSLAYECYVALLQTPDVPAGPKGRAERQVRALDAQGGRLQLQIEPAGTRVELDGVFLGQVPLPRPLLGMGGGHTLALSAPGLAPVKRSVRFTRGKVETLSLNLVPSATEGTPAVAPPSAPATAPPDAARFGSPPVPLAPALAPGLERADVSPHTGRVVDLETRFGGLRGVTILHVDDGSVTLGPEKTPQVLPLALLRRVTAAAAPSAALPSTVPTSNAPAGAGR